MTTSRKLDIMFKVFPYYACAIVLTCLAFLAYSTFVVHPRFDARCAAAGGVPAGRPKVCIAGDAVIDLR